MILSLYYWH